MGIGSGTYIGSLLTARGYLPYIGLAGGLLALVCGLLCIFATCLLWVERAGSSVTGADPFLTGKRQAFPPFGKEEIRQVHAFSENRKGAVGK